MHDLSTTPKHWLGGYEPYGVSVNAHRVDDVFAHYERCGFLYPAKRERLTPVMRHVRYSWKCSMGAAGERFLHHHIQAGDDDQRQCATLSVWRVSPRRVQSQHLAGHDSPVGSRKVMLSAQDAWFAAGGEFAENWYRAENRFPNKVFGSVPARLGPDRAVIERRSLFAIPRGWCVDHTPAFKAERLGNSAGPSARDTLRRFAGPIVAAAEELDDGDINLEGLNEDYRSAGLRRKRRVYLATAPGYPDPIGIACAYRGPLGLSFSFLESRCDLWLDPNLDDATRLTVAIALIQNAEPVYRNDYPLDYLVVACDERTHDALFAVWPQQHIRTYSRCIWTRAGFWDWYLHVDSFYRRVIEYEHRRSSRRAATGVSKEGAA